jgi:aspartyl-tRNA(Asn)/glutamyl-tRNA(Gln) amidotransferase subunit B
MPPYVPSIGMEVHAELATRSKMFCRCPVEFGGEPNTRVCPVCLGLPGALPVPNRAAIEMVLQTALALNCQIAMESVFHRKNYFYPDLPKGYQISQYGETNPLGYGGHLDIPASGGGTKRVRIRRVHLEEDTGKLIHLPGGGSGVDCNRAGVPLMEIVTEFPPDIQDGEEAKAYLVALREILIHLGVCDGKMEEGSLRCEPNISVRAEGSPDYGTKTELKNLNSFRSVQLGVAFEIRRQVAALEQGERVLQETRGWNEQKEASYLMRAKETENDYRYFPDPDLAPMGFDTGYIEGLRRTLPELPQAKRERFGTQYALTAKEADVLVADVPWARFFEETVALAADPKTVWNWMNGDFARLLNDHGVSAADALVGPRHVAELIALLEEDTISGKIAKQVFREAFDTGKMPREIVQERGMTQITDRTAVEATVRRVLEDNADVAEKYRAGHDNVLGFLIGQAIRESGGRANPQLVGEIVKDMLKR